MRFAFTCGFIKLLRIVAVRSWLHSDVMGNNRVFASEYFSAMLCYHILIIQMFAIFFQPTIAAPALANSEILPGKFDFLY